MNTQIYNIAHQLDFVSDDEKWLAIQSRDGSADGIFYYSVQSTGVYCNPSCGSRLPLRKNIGFHDSVEIAESAGFRACKKCHPNRDAIKE